MLRSSKFNWGRPIVTNCLPSVWPGGLVQSTFNGASTRLTAVQNYSKGDSLECNDRFTTTINLPIKEPPTRLTILYNRLFFKIKVES